MTKKKVKKIKQNKRCSETPISYTEATQLPNYNQVTKLNDSLLKDEENLGDH